MSKEAILFLFAALSGLGGITQAISLGLQLKQAISVRKQRVKAAAKGDSVPILISVKQLFVIFAALLSSLILSGIGFVFSFTSETGQNRPQTSMQFMDPVPIGAKPGMTIFHPGQLLINFTIANGGPAPALNVWHEAKIEIEPMITLPSSQIALENSVYENFRNSIKRPSASNDMIEGDRAWMTSAITISDDDVKQLLSGGKLLYIMQYGEYYEGNKLHYLEDCKWLQPPGDAPVWHLCASGHYKAR